MHCPVCQNKMKEGLLRMKTSLVGFLLASISFKNLYLDDLCVFRNSERRTGYLCEQCENVVIPPE